LASQTDQVGDLADMLAIGRMLAPRLPAIIPSWIAPHEKQHAAAKLSHRRCNRQGRCLWWWSTAAAGWPADAPGTNVTIGGYVKKRINPETIEPVIGTLYPSPFDAPCRRRERKRLGDAAGLTQYGVNLLRLPPGAWSSQRHWHSDSDEFVYVLSGEMVLVTDDGEEVLKAGDCAGFKANDPNGHCLKNRSDAEATALEIGSRVPTDSAAYSDIDMLAPAWGKPAIYTHRDGTPYQGIRRPGPDD
jgi:uncharacterized cupin superfamily protein